MKKLSISVIMQRGISAKNKEDRWVVSLVDNRLDHSVAPAPWDLQCLQTATLIPYESDFLEVDIMFLVMTLLVRNEEDIIAENIAFHRAMGVDFFIVTDNRSTDSTLERLKVFQDEGILELIKEENDEYAQVQWVTRMAQRAYKEYGADWVIHNDADEFWYPARAGLKDVLAAVSPATDALSCRRFNFLPMPASETQYWHQALTIREVDSKNMFGRSLPSKVCHRGISDIVVGWGNHRIDFPKDLRMLPAAEIEVLHFPMRTYAQFERKVALGGAALQRNKAFAEGIIPTWRRLYELYRKGELPAYFRQQVRSQEQLQQGLEEGTLKEDLRIKTFFNSQTSGS